MATVKDALKKMSDTHADPLSSDELFSVACLWIGELGRTVSHANGGKTSVRQMQDIARQMMDEAVEFADRHIRELKKARGE